MMYCAMLLLGGGIGMRDENQPEPLAFSETAESQTPPETPSFIQEAEPESNPLDRQRLPVGVAPRASFVVRSWHFPYAAALMASPSDKSKLIVTAERAIFDRYLEILANPASTDEGVDLRHAIEALSQLKKDSTILRHE
jgi:hypothetical protein